MAVTIETTVQRAAAELEKSGAAADQHVTMILLGPDDEKKLAELRAAIAAGDASGELLDADDVFSQIENEIHRKFPQNYPA